MGRDVGRTSLRDALPLGTSLGNYEIGSVLGHGGFGIVYKARHLELNTIVAIKEFLPLEIAVRDGTTVHPRSLDYIHAFEEALNRFLEEAKQLSRFRQDPTVVTCLDFLRTNGTAYLVMEHEDGMPLSQLLEQREANGNPFSEANVLRIAVPLLEGLSRVHKEGILHRDIKPSNILIRREDDQPVLIDFGAAKQIVTSQTKSLAPYTEGYAAIEQVGDGDLGPWTDLYGVGAVMWRMVAGGKPPWKPPNPTRVESRLSAIARGVPDPLPKAREIGASRFSDAVLDAIDKCMVLQETGRIQNCRELLLRLRPPSLTSDQQLDHHKDEQRTSAQVVVQTTPDHSDHQTQGVEFDQSKKWYYTGMNKTSRFVLKAIVWLLCAIVYSIGVSIREFSVRESETILFVISVLLHLIGMTAVFLVFFRRNGTMRSPPMDPKWHRISLAICWYFLGTLYLADATSLVALSEPLELVLASSLGDHILVLFYVSVLVVIWAYFRGNNYDILFAYSLSFMAIVAAAFTEELSYRWEGSIGTLIGTFVVVCAVSVVTATGLLYRGRWKLRTAVLLSFYSSVLITISSEQVELIFHPYWGGHIATLVVVSIVLIVTATGILCGVRWGLSTAVLLSFFLSIGILGIFLACYTWWTSSLRQEELNSGPMPTRPTRDPASMAIGGT